MRELHHILAALDERPSVAAYAQAARLVPSFNDQLAPARLALLASFTIDALVPFLVVEAARQGFAADVYVAPFNVVKQELLNQDSGTSRHAADVIFIANLVGDVSAGPTDGTGVVDDLVAPVQEFRKRSGAAVVLHNFARPQHPALGIYEIVPDNSGTNVVRRYNDRLVEAARGIPGVSVLDFDRVCADVGYTAAYDDKMWYLGRSPFTVPVWRRLAETQAAFVRALLAPPRKCLVLDLDNVLWGGVLGEAGLAHIKLGQTYPGSVFRDFQQAVFELRQRGVLLAINSKNNAADVEEAFRAHPDMVLKLEHFAATRINWEDKPENIKGIAAELGIGLESLVFFDDNPVEQELMRAALPQVLTLPVPSEPIKYVRLLWESRAFDRLSLTDEDRRRGDMYIEQAARRELERASTSLEDFLSGLRMEVTIEDVDEFAFPRVVDLLHKTNQFNLTTRRHTAGDLRTMLDDHRYGVFALRVTDRFGDNGNVGVAIVATHDDVATIDSFLLSCRVIGRSVETALLSHLVQWAQARGVTALEGEFLPTSKNAPASDFYPRHGFTKTGHRWRLDLNNVPFDWPVYIRRHERPAGSMR